MVNTRMEGRVETVEKEMETLKVDMIQMKEMMLMMKDTLERVEKKVDKGGYHEHSEGSGAQGEGDNEKDSEEVNDKAKGSGETNDGDGSKHGKLELPIFDGDEGIGWLFKVEHYFTLNKLSDDEKLEASKRELLRRFHQAQRGNGYEMLMALKQEESIAEFREKFDLLFAPLKNALEEMLIGAYQNGLKEEIRAELRMVKAQTLLEVVDLAHQIEERNMVLAKIKEEQDKASKAFKFFQSTSTKWTPSRPNVPTLPSPSTHSAKMQGKYRKLTDEELARKRRLGECFTCDEKWGPTHKCKNKHLHVLILSGPIEEAEIVEWGIGEEEIQEEEDLTGSFMSLSMNSIVIITGG
ncbi:Retrotransposable element Tf2 [Senna tora]|uniref:Retrotransposable element Tf2 n=1 Tax=Senna tora TaxID=362788 RepID=A0A834SWR9_9FABA|nr:Retrotransposable element Tf2 [Senna tora]